MSATSPTLAEIKATLVQAFFGESQLARDLAMSLLRQHAIQEATTARLLASVKTERLDSVDYANLLRQLDPEQPNNFPTREDGTATLVPLRLVKTEPAPEPVSTDVPWETP